MTTQARMAKSTRNVPGDPPEGHTGHQPVGDHANPSDETRLAALRQALNDGECSGSAGALNIPGLIGEARREAGLDA
jgi:hypothetical protein